MRSHNEALLQTRLLAVNFFHRLARPRTVFAGYAASLLVACAAFYLYAWMQSNSAQSAGGMQAFGDLLGFVALFGFQALIPTVLLLYLLRPFERFWIALSVASLVLAATGLVTAVMLGRPHQPSWAGSPIGFFGLLIVLGTPLLGLGFVICGLFAPARRSRWMLFAAAVMQFAAGAYAFVRLFVSGH
jgi:hypothetical protein